MAAEGPCAAAATGAMGGASRLAKGSKTDVPRGAKGSDVEGAEGGAESSMLRSMSGIDTSPAKDNTRVIKRRFSLS